MALVMMDSNIFDQLAAALEVPQEIADAMEALESPPAHSTYEMPSPSS